MPLGPQLSRRQLPYFAIAMGCLVLGLALAVFVLGGGPVDWGSRVGLVGLGLGVEGAVFIAIGGYYAWLHSRVPRGTREYQNLDLGRVLHRPTQDSVVFSLCMGAVIGGILVLGLLEGAQGRCYRGAPNACEFSWNPSSGWEFAGTLLFFGGIITLTAYVAGRIGWWIWHRHLDPWA